MWSCHKIIKGNASRRFVHNTGKDLDILQVQFILCLIFIYATRWACFREVLFIFTKYFAFIEAAKILFNSNLGICLSREAQIKDRVCIYFSKSATSLWRKCRPGINDMCSCHIWTGLWNIFCLCIPLIITFKLIWFWRN